MMKWLVSAGMLALVVAVVFAGSGGGGDVLAAFRDLPALTIAFVLFALIVNALAASLRFKVIASDVGYSVSFREAMAAVSGGSLGGALFFQIAGQLMARGAILTRRGVDFSAVVMMTVYERAVAAVVSGLLALAGAYFIFGRIMLDQEAGGADFIKIAVGLIAATGAGALLGHGRRAASAIVPLMTVGFATRFLRALALSLLVQLPMMFAYVVAAHALAPDVAIADLAAASSIVMFAASVPVSLAGWGIREMSAVVALGAIGVAAGKALVTAIIIGGGSMLTMAMLAAMSLHVWTGRGEAAATAHRSGIDYARALAWTLPLGAATLVLFQLYLPIGSGLLNVNLADPLAILGGSLFVLNTIRSGRLPRWRFPQLNAAVAAATLLLTISLLIGAAEFGWTQWALVNRYLGWFVLLAFATTGALIVNDGGEDALRILLLTFAGATAAVAAVEIGLMMMSSAGYHALPVARNNVEGFAQNRNAFAFQLLMAISAALVAVRGTALRIVLLALMFAGLWFAGSRSGWISLAFVLGASLYVRAAGVREIVLAVLCAAAVVAVTMAPTLLAHTTNASGLQKIPILMPEASSTNERLRSMIGGWQMFLEHPLFGAGLGAYINLGIVAAKSVPLVIHSSALWLLAETGIVGLLVFAVPALFILFTEVRRNHPDLASSVILLSLLGFGVMGGPHDMVYQRTFWLLIGAALACPVSDSRRIGDRPPWSGSARSSASARG